ncbi:MAG TPA: type II secretion system protein, partial [Phycisphaerae bacterium]|nr:type II secretion system protein [Phycisphaerae bacterium]
MHGERIQEPRRRGFTLTELVATAGALSAFLLFLVPALAIDGEREKDALCLANLRALGVAVRQYADDHGSILPGPL